MKRKLNGIINAASRRGLLTAACGLGLMVIVDLRRATFRPSSPPEESPNDDW